ncbi:MAG: PIG-L family deacetylase [Caldilineaceae bacterium]|nr:PIG-L family deacetylase [Caldilineaceae bacterium]
MYDAIYLSPHLDDVALSCGGQIASQTRLGRRVLVVTVMAGDPLPAAQSTYIDSLHERWELGRDAAAQRRAEDAAACAILGAAYTHLDIPDCIYRLNPHDGTPLYLSDDDIFGDVHPTEAPLIVRLVEQLGALSMHAAIYAPLTIGHHVDHLIVRAAAEQLWPEGLLYYEDYPYAQQPGKLARLIAPEDPRWRSQVIDLDAPALQARCDAVWAYRSQRSTFFTDRADLEQQIHSYAALVGGERVWAQNSSV